MKSLWGIAWPLSLGVLIGMLAGGLVLLASSRPRGETIHLIPAPSPLPLVVQVSGEVVHPGVYSLSQDSRVQDAIKAAGGTLADANLEPLNLAAPLQDGQRVDVPIEGASPVIVELPATRSGGGVGSLVDINTATQADLERLPEIGPALAQQILDYRQTHGPFPSIEAIQDVPGIGEGIYAKIKDLITVK